MQNFIEIRLLILKILSKNAFGHKSRAITLLFLNKIIPLAIPYHSSPIPMSMQRLKKIGKKVLELEHGNEAQSIFDIHQCRSYIYVSMHMQNFIEIRLFILKILSKNAFGHKSRAITLLFQNEISPLAIPYHSTPIPMYMQSLKKIGQKVLKLEHGNEALTDRRTYGRTTDGRTDGHSKFGGYNIIPRHFLCGGV